MKPNLIKTEPLNYLVIGHITIDKTNNGNTLGGTAAYSGLTAAALGLRSGLITSFNPNLDVSPLQDLTIFNITSENNTIFENISNGVDRHQFLYSTAEKIKPANLPNISGQPDILHLGPVANEVDPNILEIFQDSLKCLTPQGWFRKKSKNYQVIRHAWQDYREFLPKADVAVLSLEDVSHNEDLIADMASLISVFVVTENQKGARIYWQNEAKFISAPEVKYKNDTGAGDIFSTAFFYQYFYTKDPWEAGRFAVKLASWSVSRNYLKSIPTTDEIIKAKTELIGN
jgi:sugar/nucleoside kinase (ribokinase family)